LVLVEVVDETFCGDVDVALTRSFKNFVISDRLLVDWWLMA